MSWKQACFKPTKTNIPLGFDMMDPFWRVFKFSNTACVIQPIRFESKIGNGPILPPLPTTKTTKILLSTYISGRKGYFKYSMDIHNPSMHSEHSYNEYQITFFINSSITHKVNPQFISSIGFTKQNLQTFANQFI